MAPTPTTVSQQTASSRKSSDPAKYAQSKSVSKEQAPIPQAKPPPQVKKVARRTSKPIINWFQRKLAGTVRNTRRASDGAQNPRFDADAARAKGRGNGAVGSRSAPRGVSSPWPQSTSSPRFSNATKSRGDAARKTLSQNGDELEARDVHSEDEESINGSWSPTSALEADDDASVRPIPPSAPPSPSPSRSSSSYLSNPHTFRSMAASTKPTTLLSIDLAPNGMAHIAQVPTTPINQTRFPTHVRTTSTGTTSGLLGSGASITFSALPPSSRASSPQNPTIALSPHSGGSHISSIQAPLHTTHHPRNNPRPASPPLDNASVLTLASSAFAMPGTRMGVPTLGWSSAAPSALAGDSTSHFGGSAGGMEGDNLSQYVIGDDERLENDGEGDRDVDASVRALRPRSSRRGSWGSEASGWSARVGAGASLARERSLWTTNSLKTGGQLSTEIDGLDAESRHRSSNGGSVEEHSVLPSNSQSQGDDTSSLPSSRPSGVETTPKKEKSELLVPAIEERMDSLELGITPTFELSPAIPHPPSQEASTSSLETSHLQTHQLEHHFDGDEHSIAATTDLWHSAPSTPML